MREGSVLVSRDYRVWELSDTPLFIPFVSITYLENRDGRSYIYVEEFLRLGFPLYLNGFKNGCSLGLSVGHVTDPGEYNEDSFIFKFLNCVLSESIIEIGGLNYHDERVNTIKAGIECDAFGRFGEQQWDREKMRHVRSHLEWIPFDSRGKFLPCKSCGQMYNKERFEGGCPSCGAPQG